MTNLTLPQDFRALSAMLGSNPLQVQGPGGNTSLKNNTQMWIKASGTELADALTSYIFVLVDRVAAKAEAEGAGDGSCKDTVLDSSVTLRPSIETTFHAALNWPIVIHTHSILTLAHATSAEGMNRLAVKLAGLPFVSVPYCKPGRELTEEILKRVNPETQVIVLQNHGLIVAAQTVADAAALQIEVEDCLALHQAAMMAPCPSKAPPIGYAWYEDGGRLAQDEILYQQAKSGSFYPDHVVFLGSGLTDYDADRSRPASLVAGEGILVRDDATKSQRAMLQCLIDFFAHKPCDWMPEPIGVRAEAALLNWDAEKYRQALARET